MESFPTWNEVFIPEAKIAIQFLIKETFNLIQSKMPGDNPCHYYWTTRINLPSGTALRSTHGMSLWNILTQFSSEPEGYNPKILDERHKWKTIERKMEIEKRKMKSLHFLFPSQ